MLQCSAPSLHKRPKTGVQLGPKRIVPKRPKRELPECSPPGAEARVHHGSEPTMPDCAKTELPECAKATMFQRAGAELQQRAKAKLPECAKTSVPAGAQRTVPGCCPCLHWWQVDPHNQDPRFLNMSSFWVEEHPSQKMTAIYPSPLSQAFYAPLLKISHTPSAPSLYPLLTFWIFPPRNTDEMKLRAFCYLIAVALVIVIIYCCYF